jgi:hypothetical protein
LTEATMQGWARLDATQRDKFFHAFLRAALRLNALDLRAWLRRRVRQPPLAAVDPASFAISDADIAALLNRLPLRGAAGEAPGEAGRARDEADGG